MEIALVNAASSSHKRALSSMGSFPTFAPDMSHSAEKMEWKDTVDDNVHAFRQSFQNRPAR